MTAETPKDFLSLAAECEKLAQKFEDPKARATLLYVAERWRALAASDEAPSKRDGTEDGAAGF